MPRPSPELVARQAGDAIATAIADGLERIILRLAGSVGELRADHERVRAEALALSYRVEELERRLDVEGALRDAADRRLESDLDAYGKVLDSRTAHLA